MCVEEYRVALPVDELLHELGRLFRAQRKADYLICRYLADLADGLGRWPGLLIAYGDVYGLARYKLGLSQRAARERVRVGRALRELPAIASALTSGELTYSRAREITRVATPDNESFWLAAARAASFRNLGRRVRGLAVSSESGGIESPNGRKGDGGSVIGEVSLRLSRRVWDVLSVAMCEARTEAGRRLSDEEALLSVAEMALEAIRTRSADTARHAHPSGLGALSSGSDNTPAAVASMSAASARTNPSVGAAERGAASGAPGAEGDSDLPASGSGLGDFDANRTDVARGGTPDHGDGMTPGGWPNDGPSRGGSPNDDGTTHDGAPESRVGATGSGSSNDDGTTRGGSPNDDGTTRGGSPNPLRSAPAASMRGASSGSALVVPGGLSREARRILELIAGSGCWNTATLCDHTGLSPAAVAYAVTDLELVGLVRRDLTGTLLLVALRGRVPPRVASGVDVPSTLGGESGVPGVLMAGSLVHDAFAADQKSRRCAADDVPHDCLARPRHGGEDPKEAASDEALKQAG